jgi:hypothetical protein
MTLALLSTLLGTVLGLRYQLLALVPVIALSAAVIVAAGVLHGGSVWSIMAYSALIASLFQLGYVGGSLVRFAVLANRGTSFRVPSIRPASRRLPR